MTFNVKARVLLELGAELISSDSIALYELIKNAVDAGSEIVEIRFNVALTPTGHRVLQSSLKSLPPEVRLRRDYLQDAVSRYFDPSCSAATKLAFVDAMEGCSPTKAARLAKQFFRENTFIEVEDWGHGMSLADLNSKFLTIGTPNRANQRMQAGQPVKLLGEKGIGRLSAMRLGLYMEVITGIEGENETNWSCLTVDWSKLRDDPNLDLGEFPVTPEPGGEKGPDDAGTLIRMADIQSNWSVSRLATLARSEFSKLQDPFDRTAEILDLRLSFNGQPVTAVEELDTEWLQKWHGHFKIKFSYEKKNPGDNLDLRKMPVLRGTAEFRVSGSEDNESNEFIDEKEISASGDGLYSLLASAEYPVSGAANDPARYAGIDTLGPFEAEGFWFNRQREQRELGDNYEHFKAWLQQWAGGLLMYRDGYRVYPYAEPDDDWLELDQRALRRKSFKLNRGQFVGFVRVTSQDNEELRDQTNRQGLCDSPELRALIQCLQHVIWKELGALVTKHEEKAATRSLSTVREIEKQVAEKARDAKGKLRELAKRAPQEHETVAELRGYVEELEAAWAAAKKAIKRQQGQAELYLHLAGVGMLLEFVIHELNRVTHATLTDLNSVGASALPPGLRSLSRQLQTLDKRLRILDPVSTPGRQRKEETDIADVLTVLVDAHEQQFERHHITPRIVVRPEGRAFFTKVVVGQMYQIFENLISNSVYWLSHHRSLLNATGNDAAEQFDARIEIEIDTAERTVTFRDNGPGIERADREKVFEPFFSKKPSGRGIGLYIVKSLCQENGIELKLLEPSETKTIPGFKFVMP